MIRTEARIVCAWGVWRNSPTERSLHLNDRERGSVAGVKVSSEVMLVQWKDHEEWKPVLPNEPSSLAPTLRPSVPVITSHFMKTAVPLALLEGERVLRALRGSSLSWKEAQQTLTSGSRSWG